MTTNQFRALALVIGVAVFAGLVASNLFQTSRSATAGQEVGKKAEAVAQPARDVEEAALRKTIGAYIDALNKLDADGVMAFWAPDGDYINEAGKSTKGAEAIGARFKQGLPGKKGHKAKHEVHSIKFLRPDVALLDGTLDWVAPDGASDANRYAVVWSKGQDGKWLISSVRDLPAEVTEAPSIAYPQLKPLEWMVGEWVDDDSKADIQLTCKWSPGKSYLIMDYQVKREGADAMTLEQRIGWDPLNEVVRSWIFDETGGFGESVWQRDGNQWVVAYAGTLPDSGTGSATNVWKFVDQNSFIWRATEREVDGQPLADAEVKFVRKGGAPAPPKQ